MNHFLKNVIFSFMKKNQWWVWLTFVCLIISFPLELIALSYLSGKIFTQINDNSDKKRIKTIRLIILFVFMYFLVELLTIVRDRCDSSFVPELDREVRNTILQKLFEKNEIQYENLHMGEIVSRFLRMPINGFYSYGVVTKFLIPFISAIVLIGVYIIFMNRYVGVVYYILFTAHLVVFYFLCILMIRHTEKKVQLEMKMFSEIEDTLTNIHTIYSTDTIGFEKQRLDSLQKEYSTLYKTNLKICTRIKLFMSVFSTLVIVVLFVYLFYLYKKDKIEKSKLISLTVLFIFMTRFLGYTCRRIIEGMITIGSMMDDEKFINVLNETTTIDGDDVGYIVDGNIVFRDVSFGYTRENIVFKDLNIVIPARSSLLLTGDSGSGKSTFLRLLLGFYTLNSGVISIDDHDISKSSRSYLRQNIAYINQSTRLFDRPIMENILYGCHNTTPNDVHAFLLTHQLIDMFRHVSLDDRAGIGGEHLSGGMRQIILLLRCYFRDCPIVIIDEGVSNVDQKHRRYAIRIIQEMFHKKTVIVVSHDHDIARLFSRRLVFSSGSITLQSSS